MPQELPNESWVVTARCHRHEACYQGEGNGSVYQFVGSLNEQILAFTVSKAGSCSDESELRLARATRIASMKERLVSLF